MIQVKFKNVEKSELAREAVEERLEPLVDKFPDLKASKIKVTLEMENSPTKAGPDLFRVKLHAVGARYDGIVLEKANSNLYIALADLADHMLESLNRFGDRIRVKERKQARHINLALKSKKDKDDHEFL